MFGPVFGLALSGPASCNLLELLIRPSGFLVHQLHLFHHLTDDPVCQYHYRISVFISQIEAKPHKIVHLLHRSGSENQQGIVTVTAPFCCLVVICLRGLDGAKSRSTPLHVDDHAGQFRTCDVGDAFRHQADTRTGGGGHYSFPAASGPVYHMDGGNFTFCLKHHHPGGFPGALSHQ